MKFFQQEEELFFPIWKSKKKPLQTIFFLHWFIVYNCCIILKLYATQPKKVEQNSGRSFFRGNFLDTQQ
jgi:hypothetical protein